MYSRHLLVLFFLAILVVSKFGQAQEIGDVSLEPSEVEKRSVEEASEVVERSQKTRQQIGNKRSTASEKKLDDKELKNLLDDLEIDVD